MLTYGCSEISEYDLSYSFEPVLYSDTQFFRVLHVSSSDLLLFEISLHAFSSFKFDIRGETLAFYTLKSHQLVFTAKLLIIPLYQNTLIQEQSIYLP